MTEAELKTYMLNMKSREWRLEHLYWILDAQGQKVQFQLKPAQRKLLRKMKLRNVILKARQLGFTTFIDVLLLDICIFTENYRGSIIAHSLPAAKKMLAEKIKTPYDNLPAEIKNRITLTKNNETEIHFSNGSRIEVSTSARSGTYQFLHISEYGKICARRPQDAREIKTGSFPAIHQEGFIFVESTAEGKEGHFHDLCEESEKLLMQGMEPNALQFKFHFFPWYDEQSYRISPIGVTVPERLKTYFSELEDKLNIKISDDQRAWYVITENTYKEDMKREYPSTPEEAFAAAVEGAYYKSQFHKIYAEKRICNVPYDSGFPVFTFWDLGISDQMAIWFAQFIGREIRLIDYYENTGEGFEHYFRVLSERKYLYGQHYAPHDIEVRELSSGVSRKDAALKMGLRFTTVPRNADLPSGIEAVRRILSMCWFDKAHNEQGLKCLENYRKEWDEKLGKFKDHPLHDWSSNGADAFRTLATAYQGNQIAAVRLAANGGAYKQPVKAQNDWN